ncbi:MAG: hypothetical protein M3P51_14695 [Chloroflexota bacterium]|nr:hypothetical protein [Chloroflexota bacterium]
MTADEIFREVADRTAMLSEIHLLVEGSNDDEALEIDEEQIAAIGAKRGLDQRRSLRLFKRLVEENYIRVRPTAKGLYVTTNGGFQWANVEDLTDKGLREIHVLPPEESLQGAIAALTQVLERLQADPGLDKSERDERAAKVRQAIAVLTETGRVVGQEVLGEAIKRGVFGAS